MSKKTTISEVIAALGGLSKAAVSLGISNPSVVANWRARNSIPPQHVIRVEELTGISRHDLRPDIFGPAPEKETA